MYAKVITATGWTWEYLDEFVTLRRLNALLKHWESSPPVHVTAALFAGIKPKTAAAPRMLDNAAVVADMKADPRKLTWIAKHG